MTPKKTGGNAGGKPKSSATPKSGKRGAADNTPAGTPSKRSKQVNKPAADEDEDDDDEGDEEFATFSIKKEDMDDIKAGANPFFREATVYAAAGESQV